MFKSRPLILILLLLVIVGPLVPEVRAEGHSTAVGQLYYAANKLFSYSTGARIKVWNATDGSLIKNIDIPTRLKNCSIRNLQVDPTGNNLYCSGYECDVYNDEQSPHLSWIKSCDVLSGRENWTRTFDATVYPTLSPDGRHLAVRLGKVNAESAPARVDILNALTGVTLKEIQAQSGGVNDIVFSPDSKHLVCAGTSAAPQDIPVGIWRIEDGALVKTLIGFKKQVLRLSFSPDGKKLACGDNNNQFTIFDVANGRCVVSSAQPDRCWELLYSPAGDGVIYTTKGEITLLDADTGKKKTVQKYETAGKFGPGGICYANNAVAIGGGDGTIRFYDLKLQNKILSIQKSGETDYRKYDVIFSLGYVGNTNSIIACLDQKVFLFDSSGKRKAEFSDSSTCGSAISCSAVGDMLITGYQNSGVKFWNLTSGQTAWIGKARDDYQKPVTKLTFSKTGKFFSITRVDNQNDEPYEIELYDTASRLKLASLPNRTAIAFNDDDTLMALGEEAGGRKIFNLQIVHLPTLKPKQTIADVHQGTILSIIFEPGTQRLFSVGNDTLVESNWETGSINRQIVKIEKKMDDILLSPNGKFYAFQEPRKTLKVFDMLNQELASFPYKELATPTCISPDSTQLAVTSSDNPIRIFPIDKTASFSLETPWETGSREDGEPYEISH